MIFTTHLKVLGVSLAASILVLSACAPLPPDTGANGGQKATPDGVVDQKCETILFCRTVF
ncbi:MAG: hypothetical protein CBCREVIR_2480 [Candidatus Burkholderia crenata]|nr:MAG: hypothetical protein CBCREVIR_2480 [Candidatus Burkholderia crenata]